MTRKPRKRRTPTATVPRRVGLIPSSATSVLIACAVFLAWAASVMPFMPDDSFISFRYAEHLADGHGLAFNVGEHPVEAYSNFLWILVCAGLYQVGLNLPRVTPTVGILLGLASLWVLWTMCRRRAPLWTQQLIPLLLLATCGPFVIYAVSGMETALFALLLLLVVRFGEDFVDAPGPRPLGALVTAGFLASLTRPEGVVAIPTALAVIVWGARHGPESRRVARLAGIGATVFVVLTVAYHAWRVSYFGEWLPTSFMSKGAEGGTLISGWIKNFHRYFLNRGYFSPPQGYLFLALVMLGAVGVRQGRRAGARVDGDLIALTLGIGLPVVYASFVDWMPGMRYHAALAAILLVPLRNLHRALPEAVWRSAAGPQRARFAALVVALLLAGGLNLSHLRNPTTKLTESAQHCLVPLAEWMRSVVPAGSLVAIGDVGMVPYYSGLRTLDINPESLTDVYIAKHAFSADYAMTKQPAIIALSVRGVYAARMDPLHWELYSNPAFRLEYAFVGTSRNYWHDDRAYWVFVRRDLFPGDAPPAAPPGGIGLQQRTASGP